MKRKILLRHAVALGAAAAVTCSVVTGAVVYHVTRPSGELSEIYASLAEAQTIVDHRFVGEYDTEELRNYVMTGYAGGLGDRWTSFMSEEYYQNYLNSTADSTVGIGVTVQEKKKDDESTVLRVTEVAHASPAEKAGFGAYDEIVAIEGKTIDALGGYEKAVDHVRGEAGESVTLQVQKYKTGEQTNITVTREEYDQIHVVPRMLDGSIGYIEIEKFTDQTDEQFVKAFETLKNDGAKAFIFDLRNNPGGQLDALVECLDPLLPEGMIISLKNKQGETQEYTSDKKECNLPMAVMINKDSYSAAEFFAAALQEYDKAVVVGEKTCGKGYSQQSFPLSHGGCLNISTNCYYTPKGESLIGKGVIPDVAVSLKEEDLQRFEVLTDAEDTQLQAAIQALKS